MAIRKRTTYTKMILDYLISLDDYATKAMIVAAVKLKQDQVAITLHDLKRHHAIEAMEADGKLWFYATPEYDDRQRKLDEIKEDIKRTRTKSRRRVVTEPAPK